MIRLIGPGGAGESTIGALLAKRLDVPFLDLDRHFAGRVGDISEYIGGHGYGAYARENVEAYCSLSRGSKKTARIRKLFGEDSRECRGLREQPSIYEGGREVSIRLPFDDAAAVDEGVADGETHDLNVEVIALSREIDQVFV